MSETLHTYPEAQEFSWQENETKEKRALEKLKEIAKKSAKAARVLLLLGVGALGTVELAAQQNNVDAQNSPEQIQSYFEHKNAGENYKYVEEIAGADALKQILESTSLPEGTDRNLLVKDQAELKISGLDTEDENAKKLVDIITQEEKSLPPSYTSKSQAVAISYVQKLEHQEGYGDKIQNSVITGLADRVTGDIGVSPDTIRYDDLIKVIVHEMGHRNDWVGNKLLTPEEKVALFAAVLHRIGAEDRYQSEYVEAIENPDSKAEAIIRAGEYWATILQVYFSTNEMFLPSEDKRLVETVISKTDPNFNFQAAQQKMSSLEDTYKNIKFVKIK